MAYRILLVGGGSGGHVYPLVAVARALRTEAGLRKIDIDMRIMGDGIFAARAAKDAGVPHIGIIAPKLRRYTSVWNLFDILKIPLAFAQSLWQLFWFMPDVVFAKGGYTSAFPVFAARIFMIPIFLHESDSVPGLANRILAKRASLIFIAFESADQEFQKLGRRTMLVGNPVRAELANSNRAGALTALNLSDAPTILILGGSQGAQQINSVTLESLSMMLKRGWNVIHQTGDLNEKNFAEQLATMSSDASSKNYQHSAFFDEQTLTHAYAASSVIVSRAGAQAIAEIAYIGKPCILVPLAESANDHQYRNATEFSKHGAVILDGANITPNVLIHEIERLLDPQTASSASSALKSFARTDAAMQIAKTLLF